MKHNGGTVLKLFLWGRCQWMFLPVCVKNWTLSDKIYFTAAVFVCMWIYCLIKWVSSINTLFVFLCPCFLAELLQRIVRERANFTLKRVTVKIWITWFYYFNLLTPKIDSSLTSKRILYIPSVKFLPCRWHWNNFRKCCFNVCILVGMWVLF